MTRACRAAAKAASGLKTVVGVQYVLDVTRDAAIGSEAGLRQAVGPLLLSCSDEDEAEVHYVISQLWRLLRGPQECLDERGASAGRDARGLPLQETMAGGAKRNVDTDSSARDGGALGEDTYVNTLGDEHDEALSTLVGMGFTRAQVRLLSPPSLTLRPCICLPARARLHCCAHNMYNRLASHHNHR